MSALSLLSGVKRKSGLRAVTSVVDLGCVNVRARKARRMVFCIVLSRQPSPALLFFKLIEVETKFPFANSISEFSRSQDPYRKSSGALKSGEQGGGRRREFPRSRRVMLFAILLVSDL